MSDLVRKSSKEWYEIAQKADPQFVIYDPDGWDRQNYDYSFNQEKISNTEFWSRVMASTCMRSIPKQNK